jgi:hypothetical protein
MQQWQQLMQSSSMRRPWGCFKVASEHNSFGAATGQIIPGNKMTTFRLRRV